MDLASFPNQKNGFFHGLGLGETFLNNGSLHDLAPILGNIRIFQRVQWRHALELQVTGQCGDG